MKIQLTMEVPNGLTCEELKKWGIWSMVEMFYPGYSQSGIITRNDDLQKIVDGEINGDAEKLWIEEYEEDILTVQNALDASNLYIYEETIKGIIDSIQEVKVIE